ncbi:hypothetical protein SUGI_0802160 [Cryptomeria japonica]|nr:hypothetical protein SUGI_0802160 [Cryptomeria japonica]
MAVFPTLADLGLLDCMSVDESVLGYVRVLKYLSMAGIKNIRWKSMVEIERVLKTVLMCLSMSQVVEMLNLAQGGNGKEIEIENDFKDSF